MYLRKKLQIRLFRLISPSTKVRLTHKGGANFNKACAFFRDMFLSCNKTQGKEIYPHFTCATDTEQINFVMGAVEEIIVRKNLNQAGLLY
jgi:guanine nucleotide-binding protein G(i) subunit alpha